MIAAPPTVDQKPKCWRCGKLLAEYVSRPWKFVCPRCKAPNNSPPLE
jgi:phage FluMu protein Com